MEQAVPDEVMYLLVVTGTRIAEHLHPDGLNYTHALITCASQRDLPFHRWERYVLYAYYCAETNTLIVNSGGLEYSEGNIFGAVSG